MGFSHVMGRLKRRQQVLGLWATLTWLPTEAWFRGARFASGPLWRSLSRRNRDVVLRPPGKDPDQLRRALEDVTGHQVESYRVDVGAYRSWLEQAGYPEDCYGRRSDPRAPFHEKTLEHFVAFQWLNLGPGRVYLDVASNLSPVPEMAQRLTHCEVFRQDLGYRAGRHGMFLGGLASSIPLPDRSVDAITLHCAFEHFEGEEDIHFIKEAERLLRPGGRVCILPVYLAPEHTLLTNRLFRPVAQLDPETKYVLRVRAAEDSFGRHYSPQSLNSRILKSTTLRPRLIFIENQDEVSPHCYLKFVLVLEQGAGFAASEPTPGRTSSL